jgi:hypothetical protein
MLKARPASVSSRIYKPGEIDSTPPFMAIARILIDLLSILILIGIIANNNQSLF